jgi:hypothetical protein
MKKIFCAIFAAVFFTVVLSCAHAEEESDIISFTGTIQHQSFGGGLDGFYGIVTADGKIYKPIRMSTVYQHEGVHVKVTAKKIRKALAFKAWATPINIISIERVKKQKTEQEPST